MSQVSFQGGERRRRKREAFALLLLSSQLESQRGYPQLAGGNGDAILISISYSKAYIWKSNVCMETAIRQPILKKKLHLSAAMSWASVQKWGLFLHSDILLVYSCNSHTSHTIMVLLFGFYDRIIVCVWRRYPFFVWLCPFLFSECLATSGFQQPNLSSQPRVKYQLCFSR